MVEEDADGSSERLSRAAASVAPFAALKRERKESSLLVGGPTVIYIPRTMTSMPKKGSTRKGLRSNGPHKSVSPPRRLFSLEEPLENVSQGRRRDRETERDASVRCTPRSR